MLIINASGVEGNSVLGSAYEAYCRQVVIRIASYRNQFSNRNNAPLMFSNPFAPTRMVEASVA